MSKDYMKTFVKYSCLLLAVLCFIGIGVCIEDQRAIFNNCMFVVHDGGWVFPVSFELFIGLFFIYAFYNIGRK